MALSEPEEKEVAFGLTVSAVVKMLASCILDLELVAGSAPGSSFLLLRTIGGSK